MQFTFRAVLVVVLGLAVSEVLAQRCIGPKDNEGTATGAGVPLISPEDITWCDDFDSYCGVNCGSECRTFLPPSQPWLGYPPTPDNVCDPDVMVVENEDPYNEIPNSAWSGYFFTRDYHWSRPQLYSSEGVTVSSPVQRMESGLDPSRWEGWDGNPGWITEPYTAQYSGGSTSNQYHTFSLEAATQNKFPGSNAIDGTDTDPLTLRYWLLVPNSGAQANLPFYVELRLDDDHAPTDYIIASGAVDPIAYSECVIENVQYFPVVCQSRMPLPASTAPPVGCPPLSEEVHASLAFGWLAQLDRNPCNVETGRKPTSYHAAVFDGRDWHELKSNHYPGQGDFNWSGNQQAFFQMTVKSSVIEVTLIAQTSGVVTKNTATIPRLYTGPFNKISMGAAPGCELDGTTGECKVPGQYDVWRYPLTYGSGKGWSSAFIDRMALLGGIGSSSLGACCLDDGTCSIETSADCTTAGGNWRGLNSTCETDCLGACCQPLAVCTDTLISECPGTYQGIGTTCSTADICPCPTPFADFDEDGDVDMVDFGAFQACINTNNPGVLAPGCDCWDVTGDGNVDDADFVWFAGNGLPPSDPSYIAGCVSGPGVDADPDCGPAAP